MSARRQGNALPAGQGAERPPPMPRWVKLTVLLVVLIPAAVLGIVHLAGGDGRGLHGGGAAVHGGETAATGEAGTATGDGTAAAADGEAPTGGVTHGPGLH